MSKGGKRRSAKRIERDYKAVAPPKPEKRTDYVRPANSSLPTNAWERTRQRRAAEKERLRAIVRATLAEEETR